MNSNEEIYQTSYLPYINKWGKITSWLCIVIVYIPTMVLIGIYGAQLPFDATINGIIAILSASFAMYIADPLAVFPVLGTPGLYLTYLSGNSKSIRVPASLMAQDAAGTEQGTPEGNIMSCIGVAISVLISTLVMTVMIFMGKWIIAVLPEKSCGSAAYADAGTVRCLAGTAIPSKTQIGLCCNRAGNCRQNRAGKWNLSDTAFRRRLRSYATLRFWDNRNSQRNDQERLDRKIIEKGKWIDGKKEIHGPDLSDSGSKAGQIYRIKRCGMVSSGNRIERI